MKWGIHNHKIGVTHTEVGGLTQTEGAGVTHTAKVVQGARKKWR
jgi:hypothetical protein